MGNQRKTAEYIADSATKNISILPPDVNRSHSNYTTENGNILFGLSAIKGVGNGLAEAIVNERKNGRFKDVFDFAGRMVPLGLGRLQITSLIYAGALDCFGHYRSQLLDRLEPILNYAANRRKQAQTGQTSLFGMDTVAEDIDISFPKIEELALPIRLQKEKEMTALYFSGSLLSAYKQQMKQIAHTPIHQILASFDQEGQAVGNLSDRQTVTVCAAVTKITQKVTKNGAKVYFVMLEDDLNAMEGIVFGQKDINISLLQSDFVGVFEGQISAKEDGEIKLLISKIHTFEKAAVSYAKATHAVHREAVVCPKSVGKLYLRFASSNSNEQKRVEALISIFPGNTLVYFYDGEYKKYAKGFEVSEYRLQVLREILGDDSVVLR